MRAGESSTPIYFEQNVGQTDARVDFIARTDAGAMFVTPTALVMALPGQRSEVRDQRSEVGSRGSVFEAQHSALETQHSLPGAAIHMQIVGAKPQAAVGVNRQPGIVNYFIGDDPNQWHANIPTFSGVRYDDVYPGIDLVYYGGQSRDGNGAGLEYDFIVSPGADPNAITLNFAGADRVTINDQGGLVLHTPAGDIVQQKPFTYQDVGNTRKEVSSAYAVDGTQVRFEVGAHDPTRPLVIDPLVMGYSTLLGGGIGHDYAYDLTVDDAGNAYVTGFTESTNFPTTPGAFDTTHNGTNDAFVAKLNPDGTGLVYATYLGGTASDQSRCIVVDAEDNAYVSGTSFSSDFPTTTGAFDTVSNGDLDAFVAKLSADGSTLAYGTYLGGDDTDAAYDIAVDGAGNAYVTGFTESANFPTTPGAFDTTHKGNDAIVAKLSADGSTLAYGTFLGGFLNDTGYDIALDRAGNAYVTGFTESTNFPTTPGAFDTTYNGGLNDAIVTKLSADGSALAYSTYLGGDRQDEAYGIAVDGAGNAYVTGHTESTNFPTTPGAFDTTHNGHFDAYVAKLSADGSTLVYGTYLGGTDGWDAGLGIAVDGAGNAYVTGDTGSTDFPTTPDAFDTTHNGSPDAIVTKLSADGSTLVYGTYLGVNHWDYGTGIAVDAAGNVYLGGNTHSTNFPTTPGALKRRNRGSAYDAFVTKFAEV